MLEPTVLTDVAPQMRVSRCEIFGPVVAVATYSDFDEALELANATDFGLQAAVFTKNLDRAFAAADRLKFGVILVNQVPTMAGGPLALWRNPRLGQHS